MSRNTRGDKEYSRLQEALHENRRLKKENAGLKKALSRLDLDRHAYVRDIVEEHYAREDSETTTMQMLEKLKSQWLCRECNTGHLEINVYSKMGDAWYFRECNSCKYRTKSQKHTPDVTGLMKPSKEIAK